MISGYDLAENLICWWALQDAIAAEFLCSDGDLA
jgi:hypothetical protein